MGSGAEVSLAKALWQGGLRTKRMGEASREIGRTLDRALRLALWPKAPDADHVGEPAGQLRQLLDDVAIPDGDAPGALTRAGRELGRSTVGRLPTLAIHGHETLATLLRSWLGRALDGQTEISCNGTAVTRESLLARFPSAFFIALDEAKPTPWRGALLDDLYLADVRDGWRHEQRRRHERILVGAASSGIVATGATSLAGAGDALSLLAGGLALSLIAAAGELASLRRKQVPATTVADDAVRNGVRAWLRDAAVELGYAACDAPHPALSWLAGMSGVEQSKALSDSLLDDLARRLQPAATAAGDGALGAGLFALHDALVRGARGSCNAPDPLSALECVVALLATGAQESPAVPDPALP